MLDHAKGSLYIARSLFSVSYPCFRKQVLPRLLPVSLKGMIDSYYPVAFAFIARAPQGTSLTISCLIPRINLHLSTPCPSFPVFYPVPQGSITCPAPSYNTGSLPGKGPAWIAFSVLCGNYSVSQWLQYHAAQGIHNSPGCHSPHRRWAFRDIAQIMPGRPPCVAWTAGNLRGSDVPCSTREAKSNW